MVIYQQRANNSVKFQLDYFIQKLAFNSGIFSKPLDFRAFLCYNYAIAFNVLSKNEGENLQYGRRLRVVK